MAGAGAAAAAFATVLPLTFGFAFGGMTLRENCTMPQGSGFWNPEAPRTLAGHASTKAESPDDCL